MSAVFIKLNNLPPRLPLFPSLTAYLALVHFDAPEWVWGVVGFIFVFVWLACIWAILDGKPVDLLAAHREKEKTQ